MAKEKMSGMEWLQIGSRAAGNAFGAYGRYMESKATAKSLKRQSAEAALAAKEVGRSAKYQRWRNDVYARRMVGEQKAAMGAAGVELENTAIDVLGATMAELHLEKMAEWKTAQSEQRGLERESYNLYKASKAAKRAGKRQLAGDIVGIFG